MKNIEYYKILDLSRDATEDEIKKAFRNLAFKYHPDKNSGDAVSEKKFKEINNAYTVLSNSETRRRYDLFGHNDFNSQLYNENPSNFRGGNPFNPRSNFGCGRGMGRGMGCGKRSRFNSWNSFAFVEPEKSLSDDDLIFKIDITEEEAVSGTKKIIFAQTSSGKIKILFNIKPGTLDGTKIKLSTEDKIPELNDLYIRVSISD